MPVSAGLSEMCVLLDALNSAAALVDRSGRITHANPRLCELIRRPREQVVGSSLFAFWGDGEGAALRDGFQRHFEEAREVEGELPLPNGEHVAVISSARRVEGVPELADQRVFTFTDISARKAAEEQVRAHYTEIAKLSDTVLEQALALKQQTRELERRVLERTAEMHEANLEAICMLAVAGEAKDNDTGAHVRRIQTYAARLARELHLSELDVDHLGQSAILHDVGKLVVPDYILQKPGPLTEDERHTMQLHTVAGESILSKKPFFDVARQIARGHHEDWDGSGYPDGLAGTANPLPARIVHLVDVFDALTSPRVYKEAWATQRAMESIQAAAGQQFDPDLVDVFRMLYDRGVWTELRTQLEQADDVAD